MENNPFRDKNGKLLFRPGGHGALIENLNDIDADVVFVKNIDNVVPDSFKCSTVIFKKVIAARKGLFSISAATVSVLGFCTLKERS